MPDLKKPIDELVGELRSSIEMTEREAIGSVQRTAEAALVALETVARATAEMPRRTEDLFLEARAIWVSDFEPQQGFLADYPRFEPGGQHTIQLDRGGAVAMEAGHRYRVIVVLQELDD